MKSLADRCPVIERRSRARRSAIESVTDAPKHEKALRSLVGHPRWWPSNWLSSSPHRASQHVCAGRMEMELTDGVAMGTPRHGEERLPKVSVCMITYNHEKFIAQAIESVLTQKASFDYELVIGEDCSTDGTRSTVEDYARRYPGRIRLLPAQRNVGSNVNTARTLAACQGEYVAGLEGDDYWTSSYKLKRQADMLDAHPEFPACCHEVTLLDCSTGKRRSLWPRQPGDRISIAQIILRQHVHFSGLMFRRELLGPLPQAAFESPIDDIFIFAILADKGDFGHVDEEMSVYRRHGGGVWSSNTAIANQRESISVWNRIDAHLGYRHHKLIQVRISQHLHALSSAFLAAGNLRSARKAEAASLGKSVFNCQVGGRERMWQFIDLYIPSLIRLARRFRVPRNSAMPYSEAEPGDSASRTDSSCAGSTKPRQRM